MALPAFETCSIPVHFVAGYFSHFHYVPGTSIVLYKYYYAISMRGGIRGDILISARFEPNRTLISDYE